MPARKKLNRTIKNDINNGTYNSKLGRLSSYGTGDAGVGAPCRYASQASSTIAYCTGRAVAATAVARAVPVASLEPATRCGPWAATDGRGLVGWWVGGFGWL